MRHRGHRRHRGSYRRHRHRVLPDHRRRRRDDPGPGLHPVRDEPHATASHPGWDAGACCPGSDADHPDPRDRDDHRRDAGHPDRVPDGDHPDPERAAARAVEPAWVPRSRGCCRPAGHAVRAWGRRDPGPDDSVAADPAEVPRERHRCRRRPGSTVAEHPGEGPGWSAPGSRPGRPEPAAPGPGRPESAPPARAAPPAWATAPPAWGRRVWGRAWPTCPRACAPRRPGPTPYRWYRISAGRTHADDGPPGPLPSTRLI